MANSGELEFLLWAGSIPVEIQLDAFEVAGLAPPPPFYCMLPRMGYLPVAAADAIDYFSSFAVDVGKQRDLWFETTGSSTPIKWHLPGGVLFDLLGDPEDLPWRITIHFYGLPSDQVLRYEGREGMNRYFRHSLKQACYLQYGSNTRVMSLPKDDEQGMWDSVCKNVPHKYMETASLLALARPLRIPVRVYVDRQPVVLACVPPGPPDEPGPSIAEVLLSVLPHLFDADGPGFQAMMHGVPAPLDSPILDVWQAMRHPDMFLYITISTRHIPIPSSPKLSSAGR